MADTAQENLVTLTIDGVQLQVPKGTLLVEAAKQIKREIPVYCYHTKMGPAGLCRICLVEVEGMPKLQIGCNTVATDGMVVHTQSANASEGRRSVLEFYLKNHPLDCPICDKGGECDLQDYSMAYGQGFSSSIDPKVPKPKAVDLGPTIVLDEERCVVCQRCVRFDDMIVGERQLILKDRGVKNIIATATGEAYRHNFTGNVTELCPVGALTSKQYRFKARPWDLRRTTTSCTQCSVGCQMHVDVRHGKTQRTMTVTNDDAISDWWLCDRGRYNINFYDNTSRLTQPLYKQNGEWVQIGWDDALQLWATAVNEAVKANPSAAGAIGGGRLTNEEAYLLAHVHRAKGVQNLDWRAGRQRQATPGRGSGKLVDLENVDAIVIVGESPAERAPIMDLRVRKAAFQKRVKLIRVGSFEEPYPPPIPCRDVASIADAVKALPQNAKRIALIWDGVDLSLGKAAIEAMPQGAQVLTYITGEQPNARGAEVMGMLPQAGAMDTSAMLAAARDGNLAVLSIFGANPMLHYPDAAFAREALSKVPFLVVSDLFMTETAQLATLVLPARAAFEKTGTTTNLAGDVLPVNAAKSLNSPDGVLADLEMIVGLAGHLGVELPSAEELDERVIKRLAAQPETFTFGDERYARIAATAPSGEGLRIVLQTKIFSGGGTSAHDDRLAELRPLPEAALSQDDAAALGLKTGDYVDLECGGTLIHDLLVDVRATMPRGYVALIDGLPDDPANCFPEGAMVQITNIRMAHHDETMAGATP
ncbi:MAG TPA: molybdopterin-dependent oxidoreductase [Candidatus Baltobacteraceae bacterium]|nr:molybdopterin-dependent oxidoreductase [Candidatus Baltobacteraceae bacterium]